MIKVYLDGQLLRDNPDGFNDIEEIIERDSEVKGYVIKYELSLTFYGDGYNYIFNKKDQSGFCNRISVDIEFIEPGSTNTINGYFFLTDIKINHTKRSISVPIEDNTYGSLINTGKKIQISPAVAVTKNLEMLTPVAASDITMFSPTTGNNLSTDAKMYEYLATFEHIIAYLSDNGIQFSNLSQDLIDYEYHLSNNYYMENRGSAPDILMSFEQLMEMANKFWNCWFKIDHSTNPPTFILNSENEFFEAAGSVKFNAVRDLVEYFNQDDFFTTLKVGSTKALISRSNGYTLPLVPLISFSEETFNSQSDCMIDDEKNLLTNQFIYDQNNIQEILLNPPTTDGQWLEEPVIIETDSNAAVQGTYAIDNYYYYNESLLNYNIIDRHNIPTDMSVAYGVTTDDFLSVYSSANNFTATNNFSFWPDDDSVNGYDPGTNYTPVDGRYTSPADGIYRFRTHLEIKVNSLTQTSFFGGLGGYNPVNFTVLFTRRNSGGTLLQSVLSTGTSILAPTTGTNYPVINKEQTFYLEAGDYVNVQVNMTMNPLLGNPPTTNDIDLIAKFVDGNGVLHGCWFETVLVFNGGGVAIEGDYDDYFSSILEFDFPITNKDWNSLKSNPAQGVIVNTDGGNDTTAWIRKISRNPKTGEAKCELITSINNTQL